MEINGESWNTVFVAFTAASLTHSGRKTFSNPFYSIYRLTVTKYNITYIDLCVFVMAFLSFSLIANRKLAC